MPFFKFVSKSSNAKVGKIPIVIAGRETCPETCPLYTGGCYALHGPSRIHWDRTTQSGSAFKDVLEKIRALVPGTLWRWGVSGDLPGINSNIDSRALQQLVAANQGKNGYAYTHKLPGVKKNAEKIRAANEGGFTINLSSNNVEQADEYLALGIAPVVTLISRGDTVAWKKLLTPGGNLVVQCPAEYTETSCQTCGGGKGALCSRSDRNYVIGFTSHGVGAKHTDRVAKGLRVLVD